MVDVRTLRVGDTVQSMGNTCLVVSVCPRWVLIKHPGSTYAHERMMIPTAPCGEQFADWSDAESHRVTCGECAGVEEQAG